MDRPLPPAPDAELDRAYRATVYRGLHERPFELRIDRYSEALAEWQSQMCVDHSDLITAVNPGSRICSDAENRRRSDRLKARLPAERLLTTVAIDPSGAWPDEVGFLVGGVDLEEVLALMVEFGQNAWVHVGPDAIPRLEWMCPEGTRCID